MPSTLFSQSGWSVGAMCLLPATIAEVAALTVIALAGEGGSPVLLGSGMSAAGLMVLITRVRMPVGAKALQVSVILLALMMVAVRADAYGLKAVDDAVEQSTLAAASQRSVMTSTGVTAPGGDSRVMLRTSGSGQDGVSAAVTASLAGALPDDAPQVDGVISQERTSGGSVTALHWSLKRGEESRWCGALRISGASRDRVIERFRAAILDAAEASHRSPLACL